MAFTHAPVLVDEVVKNLVDEDDLLFVDATIGGGGHGYICWKGTATSGSWA